MRDLLITAHTPVLRSGHVMRTYGVARALAAQGDGLDLLYVGFDAPEPDAAFRSIPGIRLHEIAPSRGLGRMLAYGRARIAGVPRSFARGISSELAHDSERFAAEPDRGRVVADGPIVAASLAALARRRPVIYNSHNFESAFREELDAGSRLGRNSRGLREFERGLLERAAETWMVSEADIAAARALCPTAKLRYVPNVVDVAAINPVREQAREQRAIFVASFFYEPNRRGLRFLLEDVFPRVWESLPDARLSLVGAGLERPPSEDPRVEALGFVDDLAGAYASARCALVPLLQGGGTPLKFIEALAHGLPVIATPRAAAGLDVQDGEDCLLADGAEAFAAALVRILTDGAPALGRRGRELAVERYSVEALTRLLAT
jgi:glycosyltransferase involved in cell wall biosynthesis